MSVMFLTVLFRLRDFKEKMTSEGSRLEGPSGEVMPVVRYGSLLFMCPKLVSFDPEEYANFSATFHAQFAVRPPPGLVAPTFKPTIQYHADKWVLDSANHTLTRLQKGVRTTLFSPDGTKDRPIELKDLSNERTTFMEFEDGSTTSVTDDWRTSDDPRAMQEKRFKGRTVFKLASVPTGRKLLGKQSTLKPPEPLEVKPQRIQDSKLQVVPPPTSQASNPLAAEYKDTFRERLFQALAADGSYDGLESFVTKSLDDFDPQTGEAYVHDTWAELPTMWVRLHRVPRATLFVPGEQLQGGPVLSDLSGARVTITLGDYGGVMLSEDVWTSVGEKPLAVEMVRGATCLEKKDLLLREMPEVADPDLYESSARRPKGLPAPAEPTLTERRTRARTYALALPVLVSHLCPGQEQAES